MKVFHHILFWVLLISFPLIAEPEKSVSTNALNDADFAAETSVDKLAEWEADRLFRILKGVELEIKLLPDSKLGEKIQRALKKKSKKLTLKQVRKFLKLPEAQLSDKEWKELLAVLRGHNEMVKTGANYDTALNTLLSDELKDIAANSRGGVGRVTVEDPKIRKALEEAYERKFPGKKLFFENGPEEMKKTAPASDLAKLFNDIPPLKEPELQSLLGDVRAQAPQIRGKNFLNEFRDDRLDDQLFSEANRENPFQREAGANDFWANIPQQPIENSAPQKVNVLNSPPPASDFRPVPPQLGGRVSGGGGHSGGSGGGRPTNIGGSAGGANNFEDARGRQFSVPDDFFTAKGQVTPDNSGSLLNRMAEQNSTNVQPFSLAMKTELQSGNKIEEGFCQLTIVKKEKIGNRCQYKAATARHCLEGVDSRHRMTIQNIANISNVAVEFADKGQDAALMTITALDGCMNDNLVPVIPIAANDIGDGEAILVAGRAVIAGRAAPDEVPEQLDPSHDSLVQIDVRQRVNGGLGIYQGDSGGGVVRVDAATGKMELVGVISSKLVDRAYRDGIGFMAAKSALTWLRDKVGTPAEQQQRVAQTRPAQDRTVPATHAN